MTRYAYILISHENGNYAAMCLISALSVRGVDANARITVLCDKPTLVMLKRCHHQLLEVVDEILDYSLDEAPQIASRILKTTMLERLQSDFVFLDVDTIVVQSISDRIHQPYSMQMALDRSRQQRSPGFPKWLVPYYEQFGWKWPTRYYFNSGVIFVRAEEASQQLFQEWHRRWRVFTSTGRHLDQPSLNSAIDALGVTVGRLPLRYNAMVRADEMYRWGARVIHFFAEATSIDEGTEYANLATRVTAGLKLDAEDVKKAVTRRWPLVEPESVHRHLRAGSFQGALQKCRSRRKIHQTDKGS